MQASSVHSLSLLGGVPSRFRACDRHWQGCTRAKRGVALVSRVPLKVCGSGGLLTVTCLLLRETLGGP